MMKERLLLLLMLVSLQSLAFAGPRSFQQAKMIAERQAALHGIVMDESAASQAKSMGTRTASDEVPAYYVFPNGEGKGFTIVSGDDRLPEIVGYSVNGTYDEATLPANYVSFMKAYQEMVEAMEKGDANATVCMAEAKALRSSSYQQPIVAPLLGEIAWNQSEPYNNMCPVYNGRDRAVTGCVATAMAQIMAYYQYPKELKADIPSYVTKSHGLTIPAISKGEKYDWDNMLPVYSSNGYNDVQATAVAKLMYHCGAAVKMNYSSSSGANITPARLAKYFGYDADLMLDLARSAYSLAEWTEIMDKELVASRPILYAGSSSGGGHEFICDGSDGNGLYHINWGWGGYQNGYFDISILNPEKGGIGSGNAPDGYNRGCGMIIGIAPDNGKVDEPLVRLDPIVMVYVDGSSTFELTNAARTDVSEKFGVKIVNNFNNQSQSDFKGYVAYGVKSASGDYAPISSIQKLNLRGALENGSTYYNICTFELDYAFPVGNTTIYAIYSTDGTYWQKCAYYNRLPFVVNATNQSLSIVQTQLAADVSTNVELLSGMANEFKVSITNNADFDYMGVLDIYSNTSNTMPAQAASDLYVTVPAHSTIVRVVEVSPKVGDLYLWIVEDNTNTTLVNGKKFNVIASSAPILTVVKAWSNATPGLYETENAIYHRTDKVKAPKVEDTKVVFSYDIKNDGGTAIVRYLIMGLNGETMSYTPSYESVRLPGNGVVTTISKVYTPEEVGSKTICSDLFVNDGNGNSINCSSDLPDYKLWTVGKDSYYPKKGTEMVVYVAGISTGISSVSTSSSYVRGGKSNVEILSDTSKHLNIYNLNGQKVADANLVAGQQQIISLEAGIYIVDGKKIIVR